MPTRLCALMIGAIYLFFGICGLDRSLVFPAPDIWTYQEMNKLFGFGYLFSWLPVNLVHNILYIAIGGAGVLAAVAFTTAQRYCQGVFALTFLLVVTGFMPLGMSYVWGLLPLFSWNILLHTVTAVLVYYYGFIYPLDRGGAVSVEDPTQAEAI